MKVTPEAVAAFDATVPDDPRVERKKMFGHPAAFTGGHMFYGTFEDSLVVRCGNARQAELIARPGVTRFEPMEGRPWKDYVRVDIDVVDEAEARAWAVDALKRAASMPPKVKKPRAKKKG